MVVSPLEGTEMSDRRLEAGGVQQLGFGPENGDKPLTSGRKPTGAARRLLEDSDAVVMPDEQVPVLFPYWHSYIILISCWFIETEESTLSLASCAKFNGDF